MSCVIKTAAVLGKLLATNLAFGHEFKIKAFEFIHHGRASLPEASRMSRSIKLPPVLRPEVLRPERAALGWE